MFFFFFQCFSSVRVDELDRADASTLSNRMAWDAIACVPPQEFNRQVWSQSHHAHIMNNSRGDGKLGWESFTHCVSMHSAYVSNGLTLNPQLISTY